MTTVNNDELIGDGLSAVSEAAKFLGVSRSHLYRLMEAGTFRLSNSAKADGCPSAQCVCWPRITSASLQLTRSDVPIETEPPVPGGSV